MVFPVIFLLLFTHQSSLCLQAPTGLPSVSVSDLLKSLDITAHKRLEPSRLPRHDCNIFTRPPLYSYKFFFKLPILYINSCCVIFGERLDLSYHGPILAFFPSPLSAIPASQIARVASSADIDILQMFIRYYKKSQIPAI